MKYCTIVLAAGKGTRTGLSYNKVFHLLEDGKSILEHALMPFLEDEDCHEILIGCASSEQEEVEQWSRQFSTSKPVHTFLGGLTRQESVYQGLQKVKEEYVLIHDGARPFLDLQDVERLKEELLEHQGAILATACVDTIKQVDEKGMICQTLPRSTLFQAQTPQGFLTREILEAHQKAIQVSFEATDDAQLMEKFSSRLIKVVLGNPKNKKITHPQDI